MAYSKIILNGETLMDVTSDTVDAENLLSGETATKNSGAKVTGSYVPPSFSTQTKSVSFSPTESSQTSSVTPSTGYDGLSKVDISVGAISPTYVGTGIARKSSADLTASGSTVTVPVGYYSTQATKNVASVTHPNPTVGIVSSTGVVTTSHTQTSGYVASGTTTSTFNLTTQVGATITPTETAQTAVSSYRWTTGAVNVAAISSTYVGTGVARKSSADLTANGSTVTVPVGYYSEQATKNVASGRAYIQPNLLYTLYPTIEVDSATRTITANVNGTLSITPAVSSGYISQGSQGSILYFGEEFASIPSAFIIPSGTSVITSNGIYDVKNYASASVNVAGGGGFTVDDIAERSFSASVLYGSLTSYIGAYAFYKTSEYNVASFPNVQRISEFAFYDAGMFGASSRSLQEIDFPITTEIGSCAFTSCEYLKTVNMPSLQTIGSWAFASTAITSINFPNVTVVGSYAFSSCNNLISVSLPNTNLTIYPSAFYSCISLQNIFCPNAISIGSYAFMSCKSLISINIPKVSIIRTSTFNGCYMLNNVNISSVSTIESYAFGYCSSLSYIEGQNVSSIGGYAFNYCRGLLSASFPMVTYISQGAFRGCYNLLSLYLLGSTIPSLTNVNAFLSTPISTYTTSTGGVYGSIFVPSSLYNSYIAETNWSVFSSRFVSV